LVALSDKILNGIGHIPGFSWVGTVSTWCRKKLETGAHTIAEYFRTHKYGIGGGFNFAMFIAIVSLVILAILAAASPLTFASIFGFLGAVTASTAAQLALITTLTFITTLAVVTITYLVCIDIERYLLKKPDMKKIEFEIIKKLLEIGACEDEVEDNKKNTPEVVPALDEANFFDLLFAKKEVTVNESIVENNDNNFTNIIK
jgi:hypothetical protein